tara:strand:+ start:800 stop:1477 length:678 start_codon:yes stop_codon:yes gene_type:complete
MVNIQEKSYSWYKSQVRKLGTVTPRSYMKDASMVNTIKPGGMYLFRYLPYEREYLKIWDQFPLLLPFRKWGEYFIGINLHYMPYLIRYRLLQDLSRYTTDDNYDEKTRLNLSWKLLLRFSQTAPVKGAVKKYFFSNVSRGVFMEVPYPDWTLASQLPLERFKSKNAGQSRTPQTAWKYAKQQHDKMRGESVVDKKQREYKEAVEKEIQKFKDLAKSGKKANPFII